MENTKLPLSKWFMAMYLISARKKGISSYQLARDLNIRQKAAWFLHHRIREMFRDKKMPMLSNTVEADVTHVGGKWANMHKDKRAKLAENRKDNKVQVMGMVERKGKAKLVVIGKDTYKDVIRNHVSLDFYLNTDEHTGFQGLNKEFADHATINHQLNEFKRDDVTTNSVEGFFGLFKRMIFGTYHQISEKHLQQYCNELTYRFNSRKIKDTDRFVMTFQHIQGRLTYSQLTGKKIVSSSDGKSEENSSTKA